MAYTQEFDRNNQWAVLRVRGDLEKKFDLSLSEYNSGKLKILLEGIFERHAGNKNAWEGGRYEYETCEKVASLMICKSDELFAEARDIFLKLSEIFPQKMMVEMDRLGVYIMGSRSEQIPLYDRFGHLGRRFENVEVVNIILHKNIKMDNRGKGGLGIKNKKKQIDPKIFVEIEEMFEGAFKELKRWNAKHPHRIFSFTEAFMKGADIKDVEKGEVVYKDGKGKYYDHYEKCNRLVREEYNARGVDWGVFKFLLRKCIKDKNLLKEMLDLFKIDDTVQKFEWACRKFLNQKMASEGYMVFEKFMLEHDTKKDLAGNKSTDLQGRTWLLRSLAVKMMREYSGYQKNLMGKKNKYASWGDYAIHKYIKDPGLRNQMEPEIRVAIVHNADILKKNFMPIKPSFGRKCGSGKGGKNQPPNQIGRLLTS